MDDKPGGRVSPRAASALPERKRPVHFANVERHNQPVVVFVTICARPRVDVFANDVFLQAFCDGAGDADTWRIGYYILMPDHIHFFCSPSTNPPMTVKAWVSYLKRRVTIRLRESAARGDARPPGVDAARGDARPPGEGGKWKWQSDCWDTQMRHEEHYREKWEYIRQNPVRKGLVVEPEQWAYQGILSELRW